MTDDFMAAFQALPEGDDVHFREALTHTLHQMSQDGSLQVRAFRDHFTEINRRVGAGGLQLVNTNAGQNVLVSMETFATLMSVMRNQVSLADALASSGFETTQAELVLDNDYTEDQPLAFGSHTGATDSLAGA